MPKKIYNHKEIEAKWQEQWKERELYEVDLQATKNPYYCLMMFPYPSAEGLHVGNMYAFTGADVYGRFQRMRGHDVFEPIGLDGFGIHSENYAIKTGQHPIEHAQISQKNFYRQLNMIGNGYAWRHKLETYDPEYYRWTQWLFIQMFKAGLAQKRTARVNWCPSCKTVLADEQVEVGQCERCGTQVVRREVSSWCFGITKYADRLLNNLDKINWPNKIKIAQRQWIGRKEGAKVKFEVKGDGFGREVEVFTTRLDTLPGVTFLAVAPELANDWVKQGWQPGQEVGDYVEQALNRSEQERQAEKEKTGVKTGLTAVNPLNGKAAPVFVADYILMDVGTGAVMGVPAHDERDREFAAKYNLSVIEATKPVEEVLRELGDKTEKWTHYHLRDWLISRQRYWGPPIPMVECDRCALHGGQGWQPVPEEELPVRLPEIKEFQPKGDGTSPLANAPQEWRLTKCPNCGGEARRELDVSDTFLDSSWYFLAYLFIKDGRWNEEAKPFKSEILKNWLPVDVYVGGAEHAVLHLLYARFVTMVLYDLKQVEFEEPFSFLFSHGLIIKDGAKMSKSKGNVVNPDEYIERFGADALRCYLMFLGSYDQGGDFRDTGMAGMYRFLERIWKMVTDEAKRGEKTTPALKRKLNWAIKKAGEDMEGFGFNTVIAAVMETVNVWKQVGEKLERADAIKLLQLLAPFAPHLTEELYQELKGEGSIHLSAWPEYDEALLMSEMVTIPVQIDGKLRATVTIGADEVRDEARVKQLAVEDTRVRRWIEGRQYRAVFVPGRLINLVTK